jgi:schlafen family protein
MEMAGASKCVYDQAMDRREIQRLAAAEIDPNLYRDLAAHGEDLLVERKAQIPEVEKLGAEVASMANMLGGWLLLGVHDQTRKLEPLQLSPGVDLQSHVGNLLRKAVDPVPPFLAGTLEVAGMTVGFIRIFPASVPVLVRGTGAVYTRDDGGKIPISDHRALLELARSGREAEEKAGERPNENLLTLEILGLPGRKHPIFKNHLRTVVRAAPLTVTPQLSEWPVSHGPGACTKAAELLARDLEAPQGFTTKLQPHGRAVIARAAPLMPPPTPLHQAVAVADCAGIFGVAASRSVVNVLKTDALRRRYIQPAIDAVAFLLKGAEAFGDAVLDLHVICGREVSLEAFGYPLAREVHCGSAILSTPADEGDRVELAERWEREIARTVGLALWEPQAQTEVTESWG